MWSSRAISRIPKSCISLKTGEHSQYLAQWFCLIVHINVCLIFCAFWRDLSAEEHQEMGMGQHTEGWAHLGQGHQTVTTSVKAAFHVMQFRSPPPLTTLEFSMQTMSLKDGNASVGLPFSTHKLLLLAFSSNLKLHIRYRAAPTHPPSPITNHQSPITHHPSNLYSILAFDFLENLMLKENPFFFLVRFS